MDEIRLKENVEKIHNASMEILAKFGIKYEDEEILDVLKQHEIRVEGNRAYFTEEQVMYYVSKAPSEFKIYARNPMYDMTINTKDINYVAGYGCAQIREASGKVRDAVLDDYMKFTKLLQVSEDFKINGGIVVQPNDIDHKLCNLIMIYTAITNSDKCIMGMPGSTEEVKNLIGLLEILFGGEEGLKEKPRMITLINTLSPLGMDLNALKTLKLLCEYKQPIVITPGPVGGTTAPLTQAGYFALANAEGLANIALAQMINPGNPVVYGYSVSTMDVKSAGMAIGSPELAIGARYGSALAKRYNLPCRAGGTHSDANGATAQAGYESMCNMYTVHNVKNNFIIHSAGITDGWSCMSYEKFVMDLEVISMLKYLDNDIEVNDKTLALDVIEDVVFKGKSFLKHKHTIKGCRKYPWSHKLALRNKLSIEDTPDNLMRESIQNQLGCMLNSYTKPELDADLNNKLKEYLLSKGVDSKVISKIEETKMELA